MKKLSLLVSCLLCSLGTLAQFSGQGSGTSNDPYQITNADELFEVRNAPSASYKLMNDVDLTEWIQENSPTQGWNPIGNETEPFTGTFNGNKKRINGLYINRPNTNNIGLFGYTYGASCLIENVYINKAKVTGKANVGVLVGCSGGTDVYKRTTTYKMNVIICPEVRGDSCLGGMSGYAQCAKHSGNVILYPNIIGEDNIGGVSGIHYSYRASSFDEGKGAYENNIVIGGTLKGKSRIGGIVGKSSYLYNFSLVNGVVIDVVKNYSSSTIEGESNVGGICGLANATYSMKRSYKTTWSSQVDDHEYCCQHIKNNHFAGTLISQENSVAGIVGAVEVGIKTAQGRNVTNADYTYLYIDISNNINSGRIFSENAASGILGHIPTKLYYLDHEYILAGYQKDEFSKNVYCGDTLSAANSGGKIYRISEHEGTSNYALSTATLLIDGQPYIIEEDNAQQGTGYGKKTLMRQSTYEGLGYDFTNDWAIIEGETFPYFINQCRPATITSFKSGTNATISGTAMGKSSKPNGNVFISLGDDFYEGDVVDGQWSVQLGEVAEGQEAKVTVMVDDMMPSILVKAVAEKGGGGGTSQDPDDQGTDISQLDNVIYLEKTEVQAGTTATLSFRMKNSAAIRSFQFDLYLPDGVTATKNSKGKIVGTLNSGRLPEDDEHVLLIQEQPDGAIRFICDSEYDETFTGNEGEIVTLRANIAEETLNGSNPVIMKDIHLKETNASNSYDVEEVKGILKVSGGAEPQKCATPTITYANGKLKFSCETEGVQFASMVTDDDIKSYNTEEVDLSVTYTISVYATKDGYSDSNVVTGTLCWIEQQPATGNIVAEDAVTEVKALPVLIQTQGGIITVQGVVDGTQIAVYGTDGKKYGITVADKDSATLNTSLQPGSVAVVKIGEKAVKIMIK